MISLLQIARAHHEARHTNSQLQRSRSDREPHSDSTSSASCGQGHRSPQAMKSKPVQMWPLFPRPLFTAPSSCIGVTRLVEIMHQFQALASGTYEQSPGCKSVWYLQLIDSWRFSCCLRTCSLFSLACISGFCMQITEILGGCL